LVHQARFAHAAVAKDDDLPRHNISDGSSKSRSWGAFILRTFNHAFLREAMTVLGIDEGVLALVEIESPSVPELPKVAQSVLQLCAAIQNSEGKVMVATCRLQQGYIGL
jgi:hypothetical protein